MKCVVGAWIDGLDSEDTVAFAAAEDTRSRVDLHRVIAKANGGVQPYSLTALKDHLNTRCICS